MAESGDDLTPVLEALLPQSQAAGLLAWGEGADAHRLGEIRCHHPPQLWRTLPSGAVQLEATRHRPMWPLPRGGEAPGVPAGGPGVPQIGRASCRERV